MKQKYRAQKHTTLRYAWLALLLLPFFGVAGAQNTQPKQTMENRISREPRKPMVAIFIHSRIYHFTRIEVDSTAIDQYIATPIQLLGNYGDPLPTTDVVAATYGVGKIFSLKGVDKQNYVVAGMEQSGGKNIYYAYVANRNDQEEALVNAMGQVIIDRKNEEKRQVEAARQYILDNPWPHKTVFEGNTYTRTAYPESDNGIEFADRGKQIGTTSHYVHPEGAYPQSFEWKEGYSLEPEGTPILQIKNFYSKYYLLIRGDIYANDKLHDATLDATLKKMSQESYIKLKRLRAIESMVYNIKWSDGTENTARQLANDKYPAADGTGTNENLRIVSAWYPSLDYMWWESEKIPEGFFEITFDKYLPQEDVSPGNYPKRGVSFHKKEGDKYVSDATNLGNRIGHSATGNYYNKLFSQLIDNRIHQLAKPLSTNEQKATAGYITLCFADGSSKRIETKDVPKSCMTAFSYLLKSVVALPRWGM